MHHPQTENSLKKQINRQRGLKDCAEEKILARDQTIFKLMYVSDSEMDRDANVWNYVKDHEPWWYGSSDLVGEMTVIKTYTNKKGHVSLAHFTSHGTYLHKANERSVPVAYNGNFRVSREKFRYELLKCDRMVDGEITTTYYCEFIPM
jgi:hypothetical protein